MIDPMREYRKAVIEICLRGTTVSIKGLESVGECPQSPLLAVLRGHEATLLALQELIKLKEVEEKQ